MISESTLTSEDCFFNITKISGQNTVNQRAHGYLLAFSCKKRCFYYPDLLRLCQMASSYSRHSCRWPVPQTWCVSCDATGRSRSAGRAVSCPCVENAEKTGITHIDHLEFVESGLIRFFGNKWVELSINLKHMMHHSLRCKKLKNISYSESGRIEVL